MSDQAALVPRLKTILRELHENPHPHIPDPPRCKKRASVALVLRIRPTFPHRATWTSPADPHDRDRYKQCLDHFFDQEWVQNGDPEVLFMKRAARTGDRWTGHIALPGGKREPGDLDDRDASIREAGEEVGLDLKAEHCLSIGNLPERVITTNWGNTPLMVLCPFVFLLLRHDIPPLALQPTEVHSTHWVPLRGLLSPALRSTQRADVSDRLKPQRGPFIKALIRAATGQLIFSSTLLTPSESLHYSSAPGFIPTMHPPSNNGYLRLAHCLGLGSFMRPKAPLGIEGPYPLWGLTLGIVADLLHQLEPRSTNTSTLWSWPTFSHWDIRAILWILTYRLRNRDTITYDDSKGPGPKIKGIDDTTSAVSAWQPSLAAAHLPDEYFRLMRKAVVYAFVFRVNAFAVFVAVLVVRYRRKS